MRPCASCPALRSSSTTHLLHTSRRSEAEPRYTPSDCLTLCKLVRAISL
jgi:hypothetical protein